MIVCFFVDEIRQPGLLHVEKVYDEQNASKTAIYSWFD